MKTISRLESNPPARVAGLAGKGITAMALFGLTASLHAQTIIANGQVSGVLSSPGVYTYTLTIGEGSGTTTPIASVWYSWVPGFFYLPGMPTSASGPGSWSANVFLNSIQFQAASPDDYIAPGTSKTFSYTATFTPAQLAAAPNAGLSFAYAGAVDASSPQEEFNVTFVPEPGSLALFLCGAAGLILARRRK